MAEPRAATGCASAATAKTRSATPAGTTPGGGDYLEYVTAAGAAKIGLLVATVTVFGLATRTRFVDRTRAVRRRAHEDGCWLRLRNDDARTEVQASSLELADIATRTIVEARRVVVNARRDVRDCETKATGRPMQAIAEWSGALAWSRRSPLDPAGSG